jgi:hypothetical protein
LFAPHLPGATHPDELPLADDRGGAVPNPLSGLPLLPSTSKYGESLPMRLGGRSGEPPLNEMACSPPPLTHGTW